MTVEEMNLQYSILLKSRRDIQAAMKEAKAEHETRVSRVVELEKELAKERENVLVNPYDTMVQRDHELMSAINQLAVRGAVEIPIPEPKSVETSEPEPVQETGDGEQDGREEED
jgi:hypothetical protein